MREQADTHNLPEENPFAFPHNYYMCMVWVAVLHLAKLSPRPLMG